MRLEVRNINYVKTVPIEIRAKVLYQFLKIGTSMREIGKNIPNMAELDGWKAWAIIHFYGFDKNCKGFYINLSLKNLMERLVSLNESEIEQFHLSEETLEDVITEYYLNATDSDGTDVFRNIKTRKDQNKLRKQLLENYNNKCALCKISNPKLLMTRHIKPWLESSLAERIDPKNSIILCKLHDALFKNGFISLSDKYEVVFSPEFDFDDQEISIDIRFDYPNQEPPGLLFLKEHREKFNLKISQGRFFL